MRILKKISGITMAITMCAALLWHVADRPVEVNASESIEKNIAVDINGKDNRTNLKSPVFADWTINNTESAEKVSTTVDGVTFTLSSGTGKGIINGTQNKQLYNAKGVSPLLTLDGATIENSGFSVGVIKLEIDGLPAGNHTLTTWHNFYTSTSATSQSSMSVSINGETVASGVEASYQVKNDVEAGIVYASFEAKEGETVTVLISSDGNKFYKTPVLNAFEIDGMHPQKTIYDPSPANGDGHFEVENGLSWTGAAGAVSHDVYLGTDYYTVMNATKDSSEYLGNTTECTYDLSNLELSHMETYYWRVDEVFEAETVKGKVYTFGVAHLAFPTAEGYGRFAKGGRGGKVIEVTTLEDGWEDITLEDGTVEKRPIEGSLRYALEYETGPRVVVFRVGGVIQLQETLYVDSNHDNVYVAGQTAPGDGITLINHDFGALGAQDIIIRNVRVRVGDSNGWSTGGMGLGSCNNSIVDHCSISWATDEGFSSRKAKNITLQWSIIAESLNNSVHFAPSEDGSVDERPVGETSRHSFAASISGKIGSFHHNLLVHNAGRNFSLAGGLEDDGTTLEGHLDLRNNLIYNWQYRTNDGGLSRVELVNNYYKFGPASSKMHILRIDDDLSATEKALVYASGNIMTNLDGSYDLAPTDDGFEVGKVNLNGKAYRSEEEMWPCYVNTETAEEAHDSVLAKAGAVYPARDYLDSRYIEETKNTTYTYKGSKDGLPGIIDSQEDVGGYPNETNFKGGEAPLDTDHDGMPDEWETLHGLDPENYADNCVITLSAEGYTNIEMYLNELMGDPLVWINEDQKPTATETPEPTDTPEPVETPVPTNSFMLGDVDQNGIVDASDALLVLKKAAKLAELSEIQFMAGDVVKDETIDASDALQILKYAARLIDSF